MRWQVLMGCFVVGLSSVASAWATYIDAVTASDPVVYYRMQETSGTTAYDSGLGTQQNGTYSSVTLNHPGPALSGVSGNVATQYNGLAGSTTCRVRAIWTPPPFQASWARNSSVEFWFNNTRTDSIGDVKWLHVLAGRGRLCSRHRWVLRRRGTQQGHLVFVSR